MRTAVWCFSCLMCSPDFWKAGKPVPHLHAQPRCCLDPPPENDKKETLYIVLTQHTCFTYAFTYFSIVNLRGRPTNSGRKALTPQVASGSMGPSVSLMHLGRRLLLSRCTNRKLDGRQSSWELSLCYCAGA